MSLFNAYSEFIKGEREFVLHLEEDSEEVRQVLSKFKQYLEILDRRDDIESFSLEEN
jgi:hypothetical protein